MSANSKIEWTDHTWNPWMGCTAVSPACDHCYAEDMMDRRYGRVRWGAGEDRARTSSANWREPLKWNRMAKEAGRIDRVFCLSLGDIWDNEVDPLWRAQAFEVMEQTPNLIWLLLSKRIGNAVKMCDPRGGNRFLPPNAALGATMVNQDEWDRDCLKLLEAGRALGALFTFASIEPMLGPIQMREEIPDWIIVGGESGSNARPMHPDWVRAIRDQCAGAGVPFFFKQWGEFVPSVTDDYGDGVACHQDGADCAKFEDPDCRYPVIDAHGREFWRVGKRHAGRMLDGRTHDDMPAHPMTARLSICREGE